ncbi:DEAD/DEAH box helicase [Dolosigranulum pigrum]|uniref:DEAD/DEAH box helicase n=1 Tax=Dolosigranulum pigrum TaxID=29394 RepID=UPI000DBFEB0A|nr:DEAD/DEAH box helicase family protein [Dolosigranulum pigrum]QTJ49887.1 ATP-dependent helicase [Dolosigranulum pigrum]RAN64607.1 ATP-dependent helicase [Dolosigranulum pigrum]
MTTNILEVNYNHTGTSQQTNHLGMREMQERVYEKRNSQHLLIKAPPASGKSRALMFVGLDKLHRQNLKKVIISVPERTIGKSFRSTDLVSHGFYWNWELNPKNDLTDRGSSKSKVEQFVQFVHSDDPEDDILLCTHATLRFAFAELKDTDFNDIVIAIDEFHHVSKDDSSVLGEAVRNILSNSTAHMIAMTGSYFRGDSVPILEPEDEKLFDNVTYTYYEQLEGYRYLKSFAMGFKFYRGRYTEAISHVIDRDKKTIIHIPNVNSGESTKDKYDEVDRILEVIGKPVQDSKTGIWHVTTPEGRVLKVADLVTEEKREQVQEYIREMTDIDDLDIIIALNLAKEGFDWPYAEYALTIGYRSSLTEVVQIIGRVTRDSHNKSHVQFTNLLAEPDAQDEEVHYAVNNLMKAITASLLMESILAPKYTFKTKNSKSSFDKSEPTIYIKGLKEPSTERSRLIIENDLYELRASILQKDRIKQAIAGNVSPEVINKELIPAVIMEEYPDLNSEEIEEVRQHVVAHNAITDINLSQKRDDRKLLTISDKFINIDDLKIDLIDKINPFQRAYEVLSKDINSPTLRAIHNHMSKKQYDFSEEELVLLFPKIKQFRSKHNKFPEKTSKDETERKLAYALQRIQDLKQQQPGDK